MLRRQLTREKQAILLDDLSKQYETGRGGDHKSKDFKDATVAPLIGKDVLDKTAEKVNVSKNTVQRARAYVKAMKKNPKKYKNKKMTYALKAEKEERDKEQIEKIG